MCAFSHLGVHGEELDDLHEGEVLLPPDVLGVQREEVVGVHDGVDGAVQDDRQVDVPVVAGVQVQPVHLSHVTTQQDPCRHASMTFGSSESAYAGPVPWWWWAATTHEEDGDVVVDVEEGELVPLLAQDDEHRVQEVQDLADVEEPQHGGQRRRVVVEGLARQQSVALSSCRRHRQTASGQQHNMTRPGGTSRSCVNVWRCLRCGRPACRPQCTCSCRWPSATPPHTTNAPRASRVSRLTCPGNSVCGSPHGPARCCRRRRPCTASRGAGSASPPAPPTTSRSMPSSREGGAPRQVGLTGGTGRARRGPSATQIYSCGGMTATTKPSYASHAPIRRRRRPGRRRRSAGRRAGRTVGRSVQPPTVTRSRHMSDMPWLARACARAMCLLPAAPSLTHPGGGVLHHASRVRPVQDGIREALREGHVLFINRPERLHLATLCPEEANTHDDRARSTRGGGGPRTRVPTARRLDYDSKVLRPQQPVSVEDDKEAPHSSSQALDRLSCRSHPVPESARRTRRVSLPLRNRYYVS